MEYDLSEEATRQLETIHRRCSDALRVRGDSIIGSLVSKTNNNRAQVLRKTAVPASDIPQDIVDELTGRVMVVDTGDGSFAITMYGVWYIERLNLVVDDDYLIGWMQRHFFEPLFTSETKLGDRDLCVAYTLIAMRAFSEDTCMNLKKDSRSRTLWWEILKKSSEFLNSAGLIKKAICDDDFKDEDGKTKGSDDPVVNVVRHCVNLGGASGGRYVNNKLEYWFDVCDDTDEPNSATLSKLIGSIFKDADTAVASSLASFANDLCMDYGWKMEQYLKGPSFYDVRYDALVTEAFLKPTTPGSMRPSNMETKGDCRHV